MKAPASVLVVVTRRIGDVLLATPLIRSLKRAWPDAAIDLLVFTGTEGVLAANPDIRRVLTIAERPAAADHFRLLASIARRYALALSLVPSDRPTLYAWLAGRRRVGLVVYAATVETPRRVGALDVARFAKALLITQLLQRWAPFDGRNTHTVLMHLALADVLAIAPCYDVVAAWSRQDQSEVARHAPNEPYAVVHAFPKFNYKMWRREAWAEIALWLQARGLRVVLSGGGAADEIAYVGELARDIPGAINLAGKLTLSQTACLLGRARAYVGPDTAVTHMAAALAVPVVTLFGPSDPVKWGPWPAGYARATNPWRRLGTQRINNVTLIQGATACVPCFNEGCDRRVASYSDCLQQLPVSRITAALTAALEAPPHG